MTRVHLPFALLWLTVFAAGSELCAQKIDVGLHRKAEDDVYCVVTREIEERKRSSVGGREASSIQKKRSERLEFVDRILDLRPSAHRGRRRYLQSISNEGKARLDCQRNGIVLDYSNIDEEWVRPSPIGFVEPELVAEEERRIAGLAAWIELPDTLRFGESAQVDLMPLAADLFGVEDRIDSLSVELSLARSDPEAKRATLEGPLSGRRRRSVGSLDFEGKIEGRCELFIDLEQRALIRLRVDAESTLDGGRISQRHEIRVSSRVELSCKRGSAAAKALAKPRKYRSVLR